MKNHKGNTLRHVALFFTIVISAHAAAGTPEVVANLVSTLRDMIESQFAVLIGAIILFVAGVASAMMKSATPLIWAIIGVIVITGSIPIAESLLTFADNNITS